MSIFIRPPFLGARVYSVAAGQVIATGAPEKVVNFDSVMWDTIGAFSLANPGRLTIRIEGYYSIYGGMQWAVNGVGRRAFSIYPNGTAVAIVSNQLPTGAADFISHSVYTERRLFVNDYIEAKAFQTSGGNLAINTNANLQLFSPHLGIRLIGY